MRIIPFSSCLLKDLALAVSLVVASALAASAADGPFHGLFEGQLLISDAPPEPITLRFDPSGSMSLISKLEPTERESTGVGIWQPDKGKAIEFGFVEYRYGSGWICNFFDPSATAGSCTLIGTGQAVFDAKERTLSGDMTLTVKERSDGGDSYTVGPIDFELDKRSIADLEAMHLPL